MNVFRAVFAVIAVGMLAACIKPQDAQHIGGTSAAGALIGYAATGSEEGAVRGAAAGAAAGLLTLPRNTAGSRKTYRQRGCDQFSTQGERAACRDGLRDAQRRRQRAAERQAEQYGRGL